MSRQPLRPSAQDLLNLHFIENRARALELAAFLDRLDRSEGAAGAREDFRHQALLRIFEQLLSGQGNRVENILLALSDPGSEATAGPPDPPTAMGAWSGHDAG